MSDQAANNTDRELWREREGDYYADSIHVTQDGGIGMNVGGTVIVMPIFEWHRCADRSGWHVTMETAPRDGTHCLVAYRHKGQWVIRIARMDRLGRWLSVPGDWHISPTHSAHWMPLPTPPLTPHDQPDTPTD